MSLKVLRSLWSHMRFLFGVPHWIIIDMNVRQLAPKTIRPGWLAPNSQLLVDWKCTISHQDMNNMKAFARLHWWFFCGKTLSTTYSMLLWKLFGLFSLGGNEHCAEIRAGSLSRRMCHMKNMLYYINHQSFEVLSVGAIARCSTFASFFFLGRSLLLDSERGVAG